MKVFYTALVIVALGTLCYAGDILRGGAPANQRNPRFNNAATSAAADAARSNARDALSRTTRAIDAVRNMQNAARNRAVNGVNNLGTDPNHPGQQLPVVQDGLHADGLNFNKVVSGATAPTQTIGNGRVNVTVKQTAQQAFLEWNKFNLSRATTLYFDQTAGKNNAGQWIAFNQVKDPSGSPSQIMGQIKAQGQVYIINQNGIIFGGASQVNVHTLVASALPINDNLTARGLLNNPDVQFLFSALPQAAGSKGTPAFTPASSYLPNGRFGDVTVQAGAQLTAPTNADHVGGRIALLGANVTNAGRIFTPDGQTILAAGLQVGMVAHSSKDPSLRGLDVYVGAVKDPAFPGLGEYAGTVINTGIIDAPRGSITLTGKTINQLGVLTASTSVSLNGRIDLNASYDAVSNAAYDPTNDSFGPPFLYKSAGTITLGENSVTRIMPEVGSLDRVVGTKLALNSQINLQGHVIHMEKDALMLAPNADISFKSGRWDYVLNGGTAKSNFVYSGGQVYIDSGAMINVAGTTDAYALLSDNIVTLQLRGAEFSDSPLNRNNPNVRGVDITLDLRRQGTFNGFSWVGTPLADASGYVGIIQRDVAQLTGAGGTVKINSGGSVILQQGATIDVSGGFINYNGGVVKTTRLTFANHIFDISQATPDRIYDGIYTGTFTETSSRWGVSKTYTVPFMLGEHYEPGYTYGLNGGSISISAPSMAIDGTLRGNTVNGQRQRDLQATPSSLALAFEAQKLQAPNYLTFSPTPPTVLIQSGITQRAADPFALDATGEPVALRDDRVKQVVLSSEALKEGGFGSLKINNPDGRIVVAPGENLDLGPRGSLTLSGANIDIFGSIVSPGGAVTLNAYNLSPSAVEELRNSTSPTTPAANTNRGVITLGSGASINTAGLIVDDRLSAPDPFELPLAINGGSININAFTASLMEGSVLDVSGGVRVDPFGARTYGTGGSIGIVSGRDLNLIGVTGGKLTLGSTLRGFAGMGARGGSLSIQAQLIQIGGGTSNPNVLLLQPEFFNTGGFSSFTLNGIGSSTTPGLVIAPGTVIEPEVKSTVAVLYGSGSDTAVMREVVMPYGMRYPLSLNFGALGIVDDFSRVISARGDVVMGNGSLINAGPLGSVSFKGDTVAIFGSVYAPGGMINITGAKSFPTNDPNPPEALTTVYIGPNSRLSTAGTVVITPDPYGRRTGYVLSGGAINISGNIVAERGSVLDVSGTSGELDIAPAYLGLTVTGDYLDGSVRVPVSSGLTTPVYGTAAVRTRLDSGGGSIVLKGSQMLFSHATLLGNAGGPTAAGGTLAVSSGRFYPSGTTPQISDINLVVTQDGSNMPSTFFAPGTSGIGRAVRDSSGTVIPGMGYFAANDFAAGGFDSLSLGGNVNFKGPVTLTAEGYLQVGTGGFISADATVNLTAKYVALGTPFAAPLLPTQVQYPFVDGRPQFFTPTFGTGSLRITAELIDIGNLALSNIGSVRMTAAHDIRGDGTFVMSGDLFMKAAQIYPVTATTFTISVYDYVVGGVTTQGSVTFARNGLDHLPMSAGGTLNVYASNIVQGGVLRAPFGVINLGWDGTGTSPIDLITGAGVPPVELQPNYTAPALPVTQQITLTRGSITSVSGVDPITGRGVLIPYGTSPNGTNWIDPAGNDITATGPPQKAIHISGRSLDAQAGSLIDLRGGGDLYAYRWVTGLSGTRDILANSNAFAVIPGYDANYAPYGMFNPAREAVNLNGDPGYVNSSLHAGDRIYLDSGSGLRAGYYTLLPARYALMPGAFLVTPQSGAPIGTFLKPDGASFVNGFRVSTYSGVQGPTGLYSRFEVAPASTIAQRAQYDSFFANSFFAEYAKSHDLALPRLPTDSGQLVLSATTAMALNGDVLSRSVSGGRGGLIDISSPVDIIIAESGASPIAGSLVLDAAQLSSFGAESLLIGGVRTVGPNGTTVTVKTNRLTLTNDEDSALTGPEIILVANRRLTVDPNAVLRQTGGLSGPADTLLFGSSTVAGSGDGLLLRVSADPNAQIIRTNVTDASTVAVKSTLPRMDLGTGSVISGQSVIVDSTYATNLSLGANITGRSVSLNSGQVSLELAGARPHAQIDAGTDGLILTSSDLLRFQTSQSLSLLSYSSIDIFGTGVIGDSTVKNLELHAGEIRGFDQNAGTVTFNAQNIVLDNSANGRVVGPVVSPPRGTLKFEAGTIHIGSNNLQIDQYANLLLNASSGLFLDGSGGLKAEGNVTVNSPFVTASRSATQSITAGGALTLNSTGATTVVGGLGASVTLQGASATVNSQVVLPSGRLSIIATAGDVNIGGKLDVGGTAQTFFDVTKYTDAGTITLSSATGNVNLTAGSTLNLAAQTGGGNAGTLSVKASQGTFSLGGTLLGQGGTGGRNGSFVLDISALPSMSTLGTALNNAGFTDSRSFRVRTGDVLIDGTSNARSFLLSADAGKIDVTGTINASGRTGGSIQLMAFNGLTVASGALLDASGDVYDSAGKGGSVSLETRGNGGSTLNIASGSTIDLGVAATAGLGQFGGTLHLRAPQNAAATDLQVDAIGGSIIGASSITAEGFKVYNLSGAGVITSALRNDIFTNGTTFGANAAAIANRLLAGASNLSIQVGAELNSTGDITLGNLNPGGTSSAWDLSTFRFGSKSAPGVLTMRAAGNLIFYEALSDGFTSAAYDATLMGYNNQLSANAQSWSYRLTAGADLAAVDFHQTNAAGTGSLLLGRDAGTGNESSSNIGTPAKTSEAVKNKFQVIRTGSGSIDITTARDVQLLNQFATIYTAGTQVADPTLGGTFSTPDTSLSGGTGSLGGIQQINAYPAQFTLAGGNVSINAGNDITHLTKNAAGQLVADSSRELPNNWLYRRGFVDPATGAFGVERNGSLASTAWWVDFSNFFEGVGALGGGNVTMTAGRDIANVDAVIPTNARMPSGTPNAAALVELGGGDLRVTTGRNLDAGAYYVERGRGSLNVGGSIITNSTRTPSLGTITGAAPLPAETWLPTTLFVGKSSFDVSARGDVLMGPAANAFLLPQGFNNTFWYKTYFSTYDANSAVNVSSLSGDITLRSAATMPVAGAGGAIPILQAWLQNVQLFNALTPTASFYHPWLRLAESKVDPFLTIASLRPGTLRMTSFGGDVNLVGSLTLSPSPVGTLDIVARGAVNGLQIHGSTTVGTVQTKAWGSSRVNLSDANPAAIPGITSPFAYQTLVGFASQSVAAATSDAPYLQFIDNLFKESGSTEGSFGVLQTKQALHAQGVLHAQDTEPLRIYATGGDISGITLFSGKSSRVVASEDITDISLYIQNTRESDISIVASGRDIIAYDSSSPLRTLARSAGNGLNIGEVPLAGDLQISGPGVLEVLAGRNLDLGTGGNNADGTGVGITSIGNARNPSLPFDGAAIIAAAGIGPAFDLSSSALDFDAFVNSLGSGTGAGGHDYFAELAAVTGDTSVTSLAQFNLLSDEEQKRVALGLFFMVLRDAGRDHNIPGTPGFGNYAAGEAAVEALFPGGAWSGDITTQARDIRTKSGGSITLLAPGGGLTLADSVIGTPLAPPGIITESGGSINIFTRGDVDIGISRIFTLRGGDEVIWSSEGNIAAGSSSKTVQSAPPTRVVIDPQSGDVKTDLAGLATGGGIGVLATVAGVPPGSVDLIAPKGTIDAGDAGIRATGNLNIAAVSVLNASNISVGGSSAGAPAAPVAAAPNVGGLTSSSNAAAASSTTATNQASESRKQMPTTTAQEDLPSIVTVEVIGYGGGEGEDEEDEEKRKKKAQQQQQ